MLEHQHQAEYYAWQGNLQGAIVQFELATKARDADFFQSSVVETRLRAAAERARGAEKARRNVAAGLAKLGAAACGPVTPCLSPE